MEREYKYDAFISYRHVEPDQSIAKELHRMIESFKPPKELYKTGKTTGFRVFRDREELAAKDLSTSIEEALQESHYLIVLCSKGHLYRSGVRKRCGPSEHSTEMRGLFLCLLKESRKNPSLHH